MPYQINQILEEQVRVLYLTTPTSYAAIVAFLLSYCSEAFRLVSLPVLIVHYTLRAISFTGFRHKQFTISNKLFMEGLVRHSYTDTYQIGIIRIQVAD